jgi:hypothetical protein
MDRTHEGRPLKLLVVLDEYTRRCLAIEVQRRLTSHEVQDVLGPLFVEHGCPTYIRSDNVLSSEVKGPSRQTSPVQVQDGHG